MDRHVAEEADDGYVILWDGWLSLFDLGIRKHALGYAPALVDRIKRYKPECEQDVADLLRHGGVDPGQVDTIIYSHIHFDHIGDPERIPTARIVLGAEGKVLLQDAYPVNPESRYLAFRAGREVVYIDFDAQSDALNKFFGPFDRVFDYHGDGSLYLIDGPGHLQGHMLVAARVAPNVFVLLSGDACHSRECYASGRAVSKEFEAHWSLAQETARRLYQVHKALDNVVIILAHERERETEMPLFPSELNVWAVEEVEKRKQRKTQ
ncbi:hypothetical protein NM688_g6088 [Phlebia brevispora]|uniref:Uncharacterized protein n=1 Tax=Phlebia brevispora TaxID=194682 RepID=A0ACC1SJX8_9APHY|nr:hypothetical protein NM688_g6088 [Phlebia brevispora]